MAQLLRAFPEQEDAQWVLTAARRHLLARRLASKLKLVARPATLEEDVAPVQSFLAACEVAEKDSASRSAVASDGPATLLLKKKSFAARFALETQLHRESLVLHVGVDGASKRHVVGA